MKRNRSHSKVTLIVFAFFALVASTVTTTVLSSRNSGGRTAGLTRQLATQEETPLDPTQYTEVSSAQLAPKIISCTSTSLSRRLSIQFESQAVTAFAPNTKDVFYVVDDPRYTGETRNPFSEDVPDNTLNGFVYSAKASSSQEKMYFSNEIKYGSRFKIKNTKIAQNAMYKTMDYDAYQSLKTIYICDGIETVESKAFVNVPATVSFKCLAPSKPAGWANDWTDAQSSQIEWGAKLDDESKASVSHSGSTTSFGDAEDFILGYKGNEELGIGSYPLTLSYEKTHADGTKETKYQAMPIKHQTNPYDAVGSNIYGKTNSFDIIINLNKGETLDENSFEFYNIFKAQRYYIEEKQSWPNALVNELSNRYHLPSDGSFVPSLEGEGFFHQEFETTNDKYLTVATDFASESEAESLLQTYRDKIALLNISKDTFGTAEDLKYESLADSYDVDRYGDVYKLSYVNGETRANIFVQFYVMENDNNNKYEFVTYIIFDTPKEAVDEEGKPTGEYVDSRSPLPISQKANAVRPFIWVPQHADGSGVPTSKFKAAGIVRFSGMVDSSQLISTKYVSSSRFLNYTSVKMSVDKTLGIAYAAYIADEDGSFSEDAPLKALVKKEDGKYYNGLSAYEASQIKVVKRFYAPLLYIEDNSSRSKAETNLSSILAGDIRFRYTLSSLNTASLIVSYKKGNTIKTEELPIKSPSPVIEINQNKGNIVSFLVNNDLLEKVNTREIVAVGISGATVNIHLYNNVSHNIVQNTQMLNVFGNIEVLPQINNSLSYFDINLYLVVFFLGLTAVYALLAVGLFFYWKNKYKNDEFRRMRPKAYLKSALLGFVGLVLIAAAVNFIFLRFGVFNSTVPTYNPIDPFVIAFGIFGAIAVGLFIKNGAATIKLMRKRREIKRLQLDKDVADDGTN